MQRFALAQVHPCSDSIMILGDGSGFTPASFSKNSAADSEERLKVRPPSTWCNVIFLQEGDWKSRRPLLQMMQILHWSPGWSDQLSRAAGTLDHRHVHACSHVTYHGNLLNKQVACEVLHLAGPSRQDPFHKCAQTCQSFSASIAADPSCACTCHEGCLSHSQWCHLLHPTQWPYAQSQLAVCGFILSSFLEKDMPAQIV